VDRHDQSAARKGESRSSETTIIPQYLPTSPASGCIVICQIYCMKLTEAPQPLEAGDVFHSDIDRKMGALHDILTLSLDYDIKELLAMDEKKFRGVWEEYAGEDLSEENLIAYRWLKRNPIKLVIVDSDMSEAHLGGDDIVRIVEDVLVVEREGYKIHTWYGGDAKVLIIGIKGGGVLESRKHTVTENVEVILDGQRILLEKGDEIRTLEGS